jgi:HlyD family secretion protein
MKNWMMTLAAAAALFIGACSKKDEGRVQGYVEGEYVYVASPKAGALEKLSVEKGTEVKAGQPLFTLESGSEKAALDEAQRRLAQAKATLDDLQKGKRPEEIAAIEAQLKQVHSAVELSETEFLRQQELFKTKANATRDLDMARTTRDQDRLRVTQIEAELATARLPSRADQVSAAEATVKAQDAAVARAQWELDQKKQAAPQAGLVFDTLYREGEWVAAGRPAVVLLPPGNVKVRAFVPETKLSAVKLHGPLKVYMDGATSPVTGTVSYISQEAEFTPPVIYSRETRAKLVYLVEAVFEAKDAASLHPGQPVEVEF